MMKVIKDMVEMGPKKSKLNSGQARRKLGKIAEFIKGSGRLDVDCLMSDDWHDNVTPLWLASRYGDLEVAHSLIQLGADINLACGSLGMTPLHVASYHHHTEVIQLLLTAGANPQVLDNWNYSPLMYIVIHHEPFTVNSLLQLMVESGCDVNFGATLSDVGNEPENFQTLDLPSLCSSYTDSYVTHIREPMGPISGTALHLAVQNPHLPDDSVEILVKAGANINKRNLKGQTPIMGAMLDTFYDYHKLVKNHAELLAQLGAELDLADERGWTPIHYAAQRGSTAGLQLLIASGADCDMCSIRAESPLWLLLAQGWQEAAMFLLQNGCQVDQCLHSKVIQHINPDATLCRFGPIHPLEFALSNGCLEIARLLVNVGCDVTDSVRLGQCSQINSQYSQLSDFYSFLTNHINPCQNVSSLKAVCRQSVRSTLHRNILIKLDALQLPKSIRDYVAFKV